MVIGLAAKGPELDRRDRTVLSLLRSLSSSARQTALLGIVILLPPALRSPPAGQNPPTCHRTTSAQTSGLAKVKTLSANFTPGVPGRNWCLKLISSAHLISA